MDSLFQQLSDGLWVHDSAHTVRGMELGHRMTVVKLESGELILHAPADLKAEVRIDLGKLGEVAHVIAPNRVHDAFLESCFENYPEATFHAAPGLRAQRRDLPFEHVLTDDPTAPWAGLMDQIVVQGLPSLNEVVFCHRPSATLILTDLAFNIGRDRSWFTRLVLCLNGACNRFAPPAFIRRKIRDRSLFSRSVERILAWDFDRIIVGHGTNIGSGGKQLFREAFAAYL